MASGRIPKQRTRVRFSSPALYSFHRSRRSGSPKVVTAPLLSNRSNQIAVTAVAGGPVGTLAQVSQRAGRGGAAWNQREAPLSDLPRSAGVEDRRLRSVWAPRQIRKNSSSTRPGAWRQAKGKTPLVLSLRTREAVEDPDIANYDGAGEHDQVLRAPHQAGRASTYVSR